MTWPLIFLGVLSICAGWVALPWLSHGYSSFVFSTASRTTPSLVLPDDPFHWSCRGIGHRLAYLIYYRRRSRLTRSQRQFKPLYTLLYNKWYFDELYD